MCIRDRLIGIFFADLETYTCIVAETMLVSQIGIATGQEIEAVSYTHLDVYKRQSYD